MIPFIRRRRHGGSCRVVGVAATFIAILGAGAVHAASPDARALVEKGIAFHGGRAALESMPHLKSVGTYEGGGRMAGRTVDATFYDRADGALRSEIVFEFRGRKTLAVTMYDGTMCKRRFRSTWDDIPLDENRERAAHRLPFLLAALERNPVTAGDGIEAGTDVWRVEVPDGRGNAVLSFAKDDGRLVALEYPGTEAEGLGTKKDVVRKLVYHGFRDVGGLRVPVDTEMFKDGVFNGRVRIDTVEVIAAWDDGWLQVPDPRRRFIPGEELAF